MSIRNTGVVGDVASAGWTGVVGGMPGAGRSAAAFLSVQGAKLSDSSDDWEAELSTTGTQLELRQRMNVGWSATSFDSDERTDISVGKYSSRLGSDSYNFIHYPIGGAARNAWLPTSDNEPPPINLPDVQLQNQLWEQYVGGAFSAWIDFDSEEEFVASLSEQEADKEVKYAEYLGLRSLSVEVKHAHCPSLAAMLSKWLWTRNTHMAFWIVLPTNVNLLQRRPDDFRDVWEIWADIRTACANYCSSRLQVGLRLTEDLDEEFIEKAKQQRWKAEPLTTFFIDSSLFQAGTAGQNVLLSRAHEGLLQSLWLPDDSQRILMRATNYSIGSRSRYATALRHAVSGIRQEYIRAHGTNFLDAANVLYQDVLQTPLQPLADNLGSGVYNTFEQDKIKYERYGAAIEAVLVDLCKKGISDDPVLYVLGAGRGPLVTASINAERRFNEYHRGRGNRVRMRVIVVEKNPNAIVTLRHCNKQIWGGRCVLVECDMRSLPSEAAILALPMPDIIVSELLGSWGDNELSPECIDGVTEILKKDRTVCIPESYTSFAAPICSLALYQSIVSGRRSFWYRGVAGNGRAATENQPDGSWRHTHLHGNAVACMDHLYVAFLNQFCSLAPPQAIFSFDHPNWQKKSNERELEVAFDIDRAADVMGFAGYFTVRLYGDIELSIHPDTHTPSMLSWFPAVIPLRRLLRVHEGDKVRFYVARKADSGGVWYEWRTTIQKEDGKVTELELQNANGDCYYMRL